MNRIISINTNGSVSCIYDDKLRQMLDKLGQKLSIKRVSYVEPIDGQWYVDLSPIDGPKFGPFKFRSDALAAEHQWVEQSCLRKSHSLPSEQK